jgi:AraC-like DNA-binding protein
MFDQHEQTSSLEVTSSPPVHRASLGPRDAGTRSHARRHSRKAFPDTGLIPAEEDVPGCLHALRPLFTEDLAHLRPLLNAWGWAVGCRLEGETTPRVICGSHPSAHECSDGIGAACLMVPDAFLYRPDGRCFAQLGFLCTRSDLADTAFRVLAALLRQAACSISERWFRLHHREEWIVAAAPVSNPEHGLLFALDQRLKIRGVSFSASGTLGLSFQGTHLQDWEDIFTPATPMPTMRGKADSPVRLKAVRDGQAWVALLSGPNFRPGEAWSSDVLLHARPRLHQLATVAACESEQAPMAPSLTTGMRRRVEDFIESRLDMPLTVEEIAQAAGMSCSHFTRAFRNVLRMTPHRYVMWRRLVKAQELIKTSRASLAEIALVTGFSDQSHLCRLFHQHLGESPNRYRRRWR